MDRFAAMLILLGFLVSMILILVALFTIAPIVCSCLVSLLYALYLFMAYEESGVHHAQEFENRFWTVFAILLSTALLFAKDSPIAFGLWYSPTIGLFCIVLSGYSMHLYDRHQHRITISQQNQTAIQRLRRRNVTTTNNHHQQQHLHSSSSSSHHHHHHHNTGTNNNNNSCNNNSTATLTTSSLSSSSPNSSATSVMNVTGSGTEAVPHGSTNLRHTSTHQSLVRLQDMGIPITAQLDKINSCLMEIDQLLIPSTINNFINQRFTLSKEREIIQVFEECDARALNYLLSHVKLGLLFYKIKDHNYFNGKNRTELINLLAVERLPILNVVSRVILLHSLQLLKLRANPRAEDWVRNILLNTHQDELSELKTLTDAKGDYFCMNKLIYDDIRSNSVRQDILNHIRREATIQQTHVQMGTNRRTHPNHKIMSCYQSRFRYQTQQYRKVLSDVDDTLYCSGGMYPAGIDKRYPKKTVYPGVLAFYRELDLGPNTPDEWDDDRIGNLVFLSARPHVYRDLSEKLNYAKFERLRAHSSDGRKGMHTTPSLLAGDLSSGSQYLFTDDFEPLAQKKFDNFTRYVSIYPEYQHVFVCDNGQGDVRSGELMFDHFPYEFEALYVHVVQDIDKTFGYNPSRWYQKEFKPCFFRTYPEAALHAASSKRNSISPPLISVKAVQRICEDTVQDFYSIKTWNTSHPNHQDIVSKSLRRCELNQAIWECNNFLLWHLEEPVELIKADRIWLNGQKVRTPYGIGIITGFDPYYDLYDIILDWRPIPEQIQDHIMNEIQTKNSNNNNTKLKSRTTSKSTTTTTPVTTPNISSSVTNMNTDTTNSATTTNATATTPSMRPAAVLATVVETTEDEDNQQNNNNLLDTKTAVVETDHNNIPIETNLQQRQFVLTPMSQEVGEPSGEQRQVVSKSCNNESGFAPLTDEIQGNSFEDVLREENSLFVSSTSVSSSMPLPTTKKSDTKNEMNHSQFRIRAQVGGRFITKYTPPVLPKFDKSSSNRGTSLFPFLSSSSTTKKSTGRAASPTVGVVESKKSAFKIGEKCSTPYGLVKVIEYRVGKENTSLSQQQNTDFVVVEMIGWNAKGYLRPDNLKRIPTNLLSSLLRQLSSTSATVDSIDKKSNINVTSNKKIVLEFPHAENIPVHTPYGKGIITRPIPVPSTTKSSTIPTISATSSTSSTTPSTPVRLKQPTSTALNSSRGDQPSRLETIGISLVSWKLANGKHPILYATVETTKLWKDHNSSTKSISSSSIFSTIGTLVTSSRTLLEPFLIIPSSTKSQVSTIPPPPPTTVVVVPKVLFKRYYQDAAAVTTPYGEGRVLTFREQDGFYEVALTNWQLSNGVHPTVSLRVEDIRHRIAVGCLEGYPVLTSLSGLTGRLVSVEPTTGIHMVTIPSAGFICYLQPDAVVRPLKAAVHEEVLTPYGNGQVIKYDTERDMYTIRLQWGTTTTTTGSSLSTSLALLHAKGESFDRGTGGDGYLLPDEEAKFGVDWLFSFFFYRSPTHTNTAESVITTATTIMNPSQHHHQQQQQHSTTGGGGGTTAPSVITRSRSNSVTSASNRSLS